MELIAEPLLDISEADFDRLYSINAKGTFLTLQRAASHVADSGHQGHSHMSAAMPGGEMERHQSEIDPVCGMTVDPNTAEYRSLHKGETYYFCSAGCKESFDRDPAKYIGGAKK